MLQRRDCSPLLSHLVYFWRDVEQWCCSLAACVFLGVPCRFSRKDLTPNGAISCVSPGALPDGVPMPVFRDAVSPCQVKAWDRKGCHPSLGLYEDPTLFSGAAVPNFFVGGGGHYVENLMQVINIFLRKIQIFTQYFGSSSMGATDPRAWLSLQSSGPFSPPEFCITDFGNHCFRCEGFLLFLWRIAKTEIPGTGFLAIDHCNSQSLYTYATEISKAVFFSILLTQSRHSRLFFPSTINWKKGQAHVQTYLLFSLFFLSNWLGYLGVSNSLRNFVSGSDLFCFVDKLCVLIFVISYFLLYEVTYYNFYKF